MSMIAGSEIKQNKIGRFNIEPMQRVMMVPYSAAPQKALSKIAIQEDFLEVGNEYLITTRHKIEKNSTKLIKEKLKLISCYPEHYLFVNDKGIKHSLTKRDYYLNEWQYELCM